MSPPFGCMWCFGGLSHPCLLSAFSGLLKALLITLQFKHKAEEGRLAQK